MRRRLRRSQEPEPGEGALDHPPPADDLEAAVLVGAFDDLEHDGLSCEVGIEPAAGIGETRQHFRRSGSIEAMAGDVSPQKLSAKMANTLSASNRLHQTDAPVVLASVRDVMRRGSVGASCCANKNRSKVFRRERA